MRGKKTSLLESQVLLYMISN